MGILSIMGPRGDKTLTWDPANVKSTGEAKEAFDGIIASLATTGFVTDAEGTEHATRVFDPTARRIVVRPRIVGG